MVLQYDPKQCLPASAELPDSDDAPVDNELQNLIPNVLEAILAMAWSDRQDWFFGIERQPLEIYELVEDSYQLLEGEPIWFPEIGLGLGCDRGTYLGREREWLYWYDKNRQRLPTPEEKAEKLANKLRELGIDPDML